MRIGLLLVMLILIVPGVFAADPMLSNEAGSIQDGGLIGLVESSNALLNVTTDIRADVFYSLNATNNVTVYLNKTDGFISMTDSVEGFNQIVLYAYNPVDYTDVTTLTLTYEVDLSEPVASIVRNNSGDLQLGVDSVSFSWNATDTNLDFYHANVTGPDGAVLVESTDYSDLVLGSGNFTVAGEYNASVFANDTAGNVKRQVISFDVVNPDATVTLKTPKNKALLDDDDVVLECNVTGTSIDKVELWNDFDTTWGKDGDVNYVDGMAINFTRNNLANAKYTWNCKAVDAFGGETFASNNFTFTVDDKSPSITLIAPSDGLKHDKKYLEFNWSVIDDVDNETLCNLTINSKKEKKNVEVENKTTIGFNVTDFNDGDYRWFVECVDDTGNIEKSEERTFTIDRPDDSSNTGTVQIVVEEVPKKEEPKEEAKKDTSLQEKEESEKLKSLGDEEGKQEESAASAITGAAVGALNKTNPIYVLIVFMILSVFMVGGLGIYFYLKDDVLARIKVRRMKNRLLDKMDYVKYKYRRWRNRPY